MIDPDESAESYHRNDAIGSGDIRNMLRSPALFIDARRGLCDRETKALTFGIASHAYLLEPGAFALRVAVQPKGMGLNCAAGQAWHARFAVGKMVISEADAVHLAHMHERMPAEVRAIFDRCQKEVTVRREFAGLTLQVRPDLWDLTGRRKYDLKGIDNVDNIDRAIWQRRYDVQDRVYSRVIEAETGDRIVESALIFAEKAPPYRWRIIELDPDYQAIADRDTDEALRQINVRTLSGCWEDHDALRDIASPPEREVDRLVADSTEIETEDVL